MDNPTPAPTLRLDLSEADLGDDVLLEWPLPRLDADPDIRRTVERERYDEQILAALVSP